MARPLCPRAHGWRAGVAPDLSICESDLLAKAFDEIVRLCSMEEDLSCPLCGAAPQPPGFRPEGSGSVCAGDARRGSVESFAQDTREPKTMKGTRTHASRRTSDSKRCRCVASSRMRRVPPAKIMELLLGGKLDGFRRASPALTAVCIFEGFTAALGSVGSRAATHPSEQGNAQEAMVEAGHGDQGSMETLDGVGLTKDEFCEFFDAVTDFVELNKLSLVSSLGSYQGPPT